MLEYVYGDILESDAEALVNPVNCVGVMGAGLALQFKKKYPDNFLAYHRACESGILTPGEVYYFDVPPEDKYILNFTTKGHWKNKSQIHYIEAGLVSLDIIIDVSGIESIAIPALGCGHGGLDWNDVSPLIAHVASRKPDTKFYVYPPQ